jgi:cytoskeletal protein CcmA (bactofilin family)
METETIAAAELARGRHYRSDNGTSANTVVLGPRDSLTGKLVVDGGVRVQGTAEGELSATGDVQVERSATVKASIEGRNVSIRGEVNGDVTASERLTLAGSGSLTGNVKIARLSIEDGATLNGNVTMTSDGRKRRAEHHAAEHQGDGEHQAEAQEAQPAEAQG